MNLKEIEERKEQIKVDMELENADLDALTEEVKKLNEERAAIVAKEEKRKELIQMTLAGKGEVVAEKKEERKMELFDVKSPEYRTAWLEGMKSYAEGETRSINVAAVPGVIPKETLDKVIDVLKQYAPLLSEVSLFRINGNFSLPVEGTTNEAALHTENALITAAADTISEVALYGYELAKLIRISRKALSMSINDFEDYIVRKLSEFVGRRIEYYLISGSNSSAPQGVDYARTWTNDSTAVQFAAATPTAAELAEMVSLLPGAYAYNAKWLMNHKTFWTGVQAIRDDSKYPIVKDDGGVKRVLGFPVLLSDQVADGDFFIGDFKQIYANLSQDITVIKSEHSGLPYNAVDYLGACTFDSKVAVPTAFVKGANSL